MHGKRISSWIRNLPKQNSFYTLHWLPQGFQRLVQEGFEEVGAGGGGGGEAGFQLIAECHQGIDLGHDSVLFGEGWEGNWELAVVYPFDPPRSMTGALHPGKHLWL